MRILTACLFWIPETHNGLALAIEGFSWTRWELLVLQPPGCAAELCHAGLVTLQPALNIKQAHHAALFSTLTSCTSDVVTAHR